MHSLAAAVTDIPDWASSRLADQGLAGVVMWCMGAVIVALVAALVILWRVGRADNQGVTKLATESALGDQSLAKAVEGFVKAIDAHTARIDALERGSGSIVLGITTELRAQLGALLSEIRELHRREQDRGSRRSST